MVELGKRRVLVLSAVAAVALLGAGIGAWAASGASTPGAAGRAATGTTTSRPGHATSEGSTAVSGGTTQPGGATTPSASTAPAPTTTTTASSVQPPTTSTTTTIVSAPPGTLVLTQSSAGQSFAIAPGQRVQVVLQGTGRQYQGFVTPQSDDTAVVAPDGVACSAPAGQFCTEFSGTGPGSARLTSTSDPPCRQYSPPCEVATMVWWVSLTVR